MVHALRKRAGIDNILGSRESLAPEGGVAGVRGDVQQEKLETKIRAPINRF